MTTPGAGYRLCTTDLERIAMSVVRSPQHTITAVTLAAAQRRLRVGGRCTDAYAPPDVVAAIRGRSLFALAPMLLSGLSMVPDLVAPLEAPRDIPAPEQWDALRCAAPDVLTGDIQRRLGEDVPVHWGRVLDQPQRWLESMADASADTWSALAGLWYRTQGLFDREMRRLGVARVRGQTRTLLDNLHPRLRVVNDTVVKTDSYRQASVDLAGRHLLLVPLLGDPMTVVVNFDRPDVVTICYPLPGFGAARDDDPGTDALAIVLGTARAATLRAATTTQPIGAIARALHLAPNTATYHCAYLERAGLLRRERHHQSVHVLITERGRHLIEAMSTTPG